MTTKNILIAEDHPLVVSGMKRIIETVYPDCKIDVTDSCESFLKTITDIEIKYCIVDLYLTDGMAFDLIENVLKLLPDTSILVYTAFPGEMYAKRLFKMGIHGFLNKKANEEQIKECLQKFLNDEFYVSKEFLPLIFNKEKRQLFKMNPFDLLSMQEMIVIEYMLEGFSSKNISEKMNIMPNTIATYKKRAFQKLEIENIIQLSSLYDSFDNNMVTLLKDTSEMNDKNNI